MTHCHNEVQQTQVDVLCTAVETRAAKLASELCAAVLNGAKLRGQFYARRPDGPTRHLPVQCSQVIQGCVGSASFAGELEIFQKAQMRKE